MRIALCLSGQPRFFKQGYQSLMQTLLSRYNCDLFIHSWYSEELLGKPFSTTHGGTVGKVGFVEKDTPVQVVDLYKPVSYRFDKPIDFNSNLTFTQENVRAGVNVNGIYSMFYSIKESILLAEEYELANNFKYDLVVRLRFDLQFVSEIVFESYDLNYLYVPRSGNPNVYYDIFGFGSSSLMSNYKNVFFDIERVWNPNKHFVGENILTDSLSLHNIPVTKIDWTINLIRS
jgi:hypothetical protein